MTIVMIFGFTMVVSEVTPAISPKNHPFPVLLYLEWGLLGLSLASELAPAPLPVRTWGPGVAIAALLSFTALGFWLPQRQRWFQATHILAQFGLIFLASKSGFLGLRLFPALYPILLIRSCLMVPWAGRLTVLVGSWLMFATILQMRLRVLAQRWQQRIPPPGFPSRPPRGLGVAGVQVNILILFAVLMVFVLLLVDTLLAERERREELRRANDQLRASAAQIETLAMAQERGRIARDIHDSLGHVLTALNIQLESAVKLWVAHPQQAHGFLLQAKGMGSTALEEVRRAVAAMGTDPLAGQSLAAAIAQLAQQFQGMTGLTPGVTVEVPTLSPHLRVNIYRMVQEALTNVARHAQASQVEISIRGDGSGGEVPKGIWVWVRDDGQGFIWSNTARGFGLKGLQERVQSDGGWLRIHSAPGAGCQVEIWLPLSPGPMAAPTAGELP